MIGPLFAFMLGGAQGVAPVPETWNPATVRLIPAKIVALAPDSPEPAQVPEGESAEEPTGDSAAERASEPMPFRLGRSVVFPAL